MNKFILIILSALFLSACDPFASLDDESSKAKQKNISDEEPRWKCTEIFSPKSILCSLNNQSVTVELKNIIVPGFFADNEKTFFNENVNLSDDELIKFANEAFAFSSNLMLDMDVSLSPTPKPNNKFSFARVTVIPGGDAEARLLNEGLAILKPDLSPNIFDRYNHIQQKAIDCGESIWAAKISSSNDFSIDVNISLKPVIYAKSQTKNFKNLPKFHSPDLYSAPEFKQIDGEALEDISNAEMALTVSAKIHIKKSKKIYNLSLKIRPHVLEKKYSGPLNSFKKNIYDWEQDNCHATGGELVTLKVEYAPIEISRVIKGANISVFTGAIIEKCDVIILNGDSIIYKSEKVFSKNITLNALNFFTDYYF